MAGGLSALHKIDFIIKKIPQQFFIKKWFAYALVGALSVSILFPGFVRAVTGVPEIINFQGRLMDDAGALLGGAGTDYCFKFAIWDVSTGGTANPNQLWPDSYADPSAMTLVVRSGVFDASIGSGVDTLNYNFQSNDTVYIDIQVADKVGASCTTGGDEVFERLDPRQQIVSSAFAINSGTVLGFTPAQSATDSQIPVLTTGGVILGHATTARLASVGAAPLAIDAGSSGTLNINNTSTGDILLGGGSASTGCTLTNSTGAFACAAGFSGSGLSLTSTNTTQVTTASALALNVNSLTEGTGLYAASSSLTTGKLVDLQVSGTAAGASQTALNILTTGANATSSITTYGLQVSNTHTGTSSVDYAGSFTATGGGTTSTAIGLYATASGGTTANYAGIFDAGQVLIGATTATTGSLSKLNIISSMASNGSTTAIAGIHGEYTINPTAGGTQVANRFVMNNAPTNATANTSINQIVRTIDNTTLANLVRGIEVVSNAGSNTAGTNTGIRTTGATFGIQALTNAAAGGVSLPAAIYGESTGTTQGDILRLYTGTMTSAPSIFQIYHDTSAFTGAVLLVDMAKSGGGTSFSGNFLDFQNASVQKFKVTSAGVTSMGLSATASTTAVCSSLAPGATPGAGTAYEIRDCSGAPVLDYAEMFPVASDAVYGDVVAMGTEMVEYYADDGYGNILYDAPKRKVTKLIKADHLYQNNVVGIVSLNYGDFSSVGHGVIDKEDNPMPIALNGRVPVNISQTSEAIAPGDYLTTSADVGKATKATGAGQVIGKALGSWEPGSNTDQIMVFIEQGYYNGQDLGNSTGIVLNDISTDTSETTSSFSSQKTLEEFLASGNQMQLAELDVSELSVGRLIAGLEIITPLLTASVAEAATLNVSESATFAGLTLLSGTTTFSGSVAFDSEVEFNLAPVFNKDTAGFAIIKEGDRSVRVSFEKPYAMTPIVTTSIVFEATDNIDQVTADTLLGENITSLVLDKDPTGFTILLNKRAPQNIRFSWIALGVKDAGVFESLGDGLEFASPTPEPAPESIVSPAPEPELTPEPVLEIIPEPVPELIEPEGSSEPERPLPEVSPAPEPEPIPEIIPEPAPEPAPEEVAPAPEETPAPEPTP